MERVPDNAMAGASQAFHGVEPTFTHTETRQAELHVLTRASVECLRNLLLLRGLGPRSASLAPSGLRRYSVLNASAVQSPPPCSSTVCCAVLE